MIIFFKKIVIFYKKIFKENINISDVYDRHGAFLAFKWFNNKSQFNQKIDFKLLQNILNFTMINLTNNKTWDFYLPDISDYKEKVI